MIDWIDGLIKWLMDCLLALLSSSPAGWPAAGSLACLFACSLVVRHPYAVVVEYVLPYRDYSTLYYM